ncbi:MAG: MBL fold metallo-hydrolase [Bacteroidota bacterium]
MKISFHGAARTVTGSKHLLKLNSGLNILLDCGFFQGLGPETDTLNRHFGFDPAEVDILILSHAHIDHSGNIPLLVKQGFKGKIYCTAATHDLAAIMLADTAHIQENDLKYVNKKRAAKDKSPLQPIYTIEDVDAAMELFFTLPYRKEIEIAPDVKVSFTDSGHILGAAAVNLKIKENGKEIRLTFTGDIGRPGDKILKVPDVFPQAEYIICESTYGNRLHESTEDSEKNLLEIVRHTCVEKKGKLIIPAFSLGRTQEVVYVLNILKNAGLLPAIPVYVDSPLSVNATAIMKAHPECFNGEILKSLRQDPDPFGFENLHYIQQVKDSIALNDMDKPMIIISASGMADAGRIKHHIKNNIKDPKNTILLVGYCSPGSLGGRLAAGQKEVRIFGKEYEVLSEVVQMSSYSAHGDYKEMLQYLSCQKPAEIKEMFLVHGEHEVQVDWKEKLLDSGFKKITIPELHSTFEIN